MLFLKKNDTGDAVAMLQEMLIEAGHSLLVNALFDTATETAVAEFQLKNNLVSDGKVFTKTWTKLINSSSLKNMEKKFLKEEDMITTAAELGVELAALKAVNEVESGGRGFLINGLPKILFEGHEFWRQLTARGIDPLQYVTGNENVLYKKWTKKFYLGGKAEWDRLNKAISIAKNTDGADTVKAITEAAYASASYGSFQIMGYHYSSLGYTEIIKFLGDMKHSEGRQLKILGKFLKVNNMIADLKNKKWAAFALKYNGKGFKENKYDIKLAAAYRRFSS
jgi:N-acetylmuramidase/Putative peptidoglycan binding domain